MALVTITYNAWDHNRKTIPAAQRPRVGFRPVSSDLTTAGLLTSRAVWGTLDTATGSGEVKLESAPGVVYVPFMTWSASDDADEADALGGCEWDPIFPGDGGPIEKLPPVVRLSGVWYGFGEPPTPIRQRNDSIYLDITGPGVAVWAPSSAMFSEGITL